MKNHKLAWVVTILLVVAAIALGQFKAPVEQSDSFFVTDAADLFSAQEEAAILSDCQALAQTTEARMVIVTVEHTGLRSLEAYANLLCEEWYLTGADLLLVMTADNYYLSVDFGWWPEIEEQLDYLLNRCLEPEFGVKHYSAAVQDLTAGVEAVLLGSGDSGFEDWGDEYGSDGGSLLWAVLIVVVIIVVVMTVSKNQPASKRSYYGGYASPRPVSRPIVIHTTTHRPSFGPTYRTSSSSRPVSRPSSFGGGGSRGGAGRSMGGSRGGGGRGGGSRGGGGRR